MMGQSGSYVCQETAALGIELFVQTTVRERDTRERFMYEK